MRQKILFLILLFMVLVFTKKEVGNTLDSLALINIEALASDETKNVYCFGIGSIDCPVYHTKVYEVWQ